jgi:hypothetical protein
LHPSWHIVSKVVSFFLKYFAKSTSPCTLTLFDDKWLLIFVTCVEPINKCFYFSSLVNADSVCTIWGLFIMAANGEWLFAGELPHFRVGLVLEVLRLDAWYVDGERSQHLQAVHITQGLCRRCCLPELILRCMEVLHCPHSPPLLFALEVTNVCGSDLMVQVISSTDAYKHAL